MVATLIELTVLFLLAFAQISGSVLLQGNIYNDRELESGLCPSHCSCHHTEIRCNYLTQSVLRSLDEKIDRM